MTWRRAFGVTGPSVAIVHTSRLQRGVFVATILVDGGLWDVLVGDSEHDAQSAAERTIQAMGIVAAGQKVVSRVRCGRAQAPYLAHIDEAVLLGRR